MVGELAVRVTADSSEFGQKLEQSVASTSQKLLGGVGLASAAGLAATTAAVTGLYAIGSTLDSEFDKIRINTGETGDALVSLQESFTAVARTVPTDMGSVGTAIADLNMSTGATGEGLENMARQFLELSRITETDVGANIETVTALFNQFNIAAEDQGPVLDNLFQASQASGISVAELADAVNKGGAIFSQFGLDVTESADLLALLGKNGVSTREATMGLNSVLADSAAAGVPARDALQFFSEAIKGAATEADAAAIGIDAFGPRAGAKLAAQIRDGTLSLDDFQSALGASGDTIIDVGKETSDAAESFTLLKNNLTAALGPAASRLFDTVGKSAAEMAPAIIMMVEAFIPLIEAFASLPAPVLAGLIGVLAAGAMIGKIAAPIMTAVKAFQLLSSAMMGNPWVLIIAATIALAIIIVKNWDTIKQAIGVALDWVQAKIQLVWSIIQEITSLVWGTIVGVLSATWETIKGVVSTAVDIVKVVIQTAWDIISTIIGTVMGVITGVITTAWGTIQTIVTTAVGIVRTVIETAWGLIRTIIETGMAVIRGVIETAWGLIVGVFEFAKGLIEGIIGGVVDIVGKVGDGLNTVKDTAIGAWDWIVGKFVWAKDEIVKLAGQIKEAVKDALGPLGDLISGVGGLVGKGLDLIGFDLGGIVPGPKGAPRLLIAHGGETILPTHKPGYVQALTPARIGLPGPSPSQPVYVNVTLKDAVIREDRDVVLLARSLGREQERMLNARGVRTTAGGLR